MDHCQQSEVSRALMDFLDLIRNPEGDWDLFRLSLEVSRIPSPDVDFEACYEIFNQLAADARSLLGPHEDTYGCIEILNHIVFDKWGFQGNTEDYYNPRNSYMSHVLASRQGIPVTLSVLYRETALKLGLELDYVGMPGHFLLKCRLPAREIFLDVFSRWKILLEEECLERLDSLHSDPTESAMYHLRSVSYRAVLLRILLNLKHISARQGNFALLLQVLERRVPLQLDPSAEVLERGLARISVQDYRGALEDLEFFLQNTRNPEMKKLLEPQLVRIRQMATEH